jgi:hypothetical protein
MLPEVIALSGFHCNLKTFSVNKFVFLGNHLFRQQIPQRRKRFHLHFVTQLHQRNRSRRRLDLVRTFQDQIGEINYFLKVNLIEFNTPFA